MLVKVLAGRHAGEIRDVSNESALEMIRQGRYGQAFAPESAAPRVVAAEPSVAPVQKKKGKSGR